MMDTPLERDSHIEPTENINSKSSEARSNANLTLLQGKRLRKTKRQDMSVVNNPKKGTRNMERQGNALESNNTNHDSKGDASSIKTLPLATEAVINISTKTDSEMVHFDSELSSPPEKKKRKKRRKKNKALQSIDNDHVPQEDTSSIKITPLVTEAVINSNPETDSQISNLGSELSSPLEKRKRKKRKKMHNALKINDEDLVPQEDTSSFKTTPLVTEAVINISPKTDSEVTHLDLELSCPLEKRKRKKWKKMHNALKINDEELVPQEDTSSIKTTPLVTEAVVNISPKTDSEVTHLNFELSCPKEKRKRKNRRKKNDALQIIDNDHVPHEDTSSIKITPPVTEAAINLLYLAEKNTEAVINSNPENNSQISHLDSELSCPLEKRKKKKQKGKNILLADSYSQAPAHICMERKTTVQDALQKDDNFDKNSFNNNLKSCDGLSGHDYSCNHLQQNKLGRKANMKGVIPSSSSLGVTKDNNALHIKLKESDVPPILHSSPERICFGISKKKLLVLDLNGLLADIVPYAPREYKPCARMAGRKLVFKRPFFDDFMQFCFERFDVAVWSSRAKKNVEKLLNILFGDSQKKLLFCWDRSSCTVTKFQTIENKEKPLVLKELEKVWDYIYRVHAKEKGEYNESNTLLLDDSPYKALRNPAHTAIFPYSYQYKDAEDCSLGPGGDLRLYLERLALAENVQKFVEQNPFGQQAITESDPSWDFYLKIIGTNSCQTES